MTAPESQSKAAASAGSGGGPPLSSQLRNVQLGLREDLDVSRHLFRGEPSYIIRDPVTFQSQRLTPEDYDVFVRISADRPLGSIFEDLVKEGKATPDVEEQFYTFIMMLHRIGFLRLPVSDDKVLYRRHQMKMRAKAKEKITGILFLKIPLVNPDAFLDRTVRFWSWMFTPQFFAVWLTVIFAAGYIIFRRWGEVTEPLQGLLATQNLPMMWLSLIVLKLYHELGHAYCCKHYGGHVPEMGAFMIMFTPCAYVDATASWGFTHKRHRLYVCLAGMYFESMMAAIAVFVWALAGPGLVKSGAYNVVFLATVVTVLFNINPLMKYDGYYVLSDLTEIPNLRTRSSNHVMAFLKKIFFGIPNDSAPASRRERWILMSYGVASSIYKVVLLLTISAMLATKVFVVGVVMACLYLGSTIFKTLTRLTAYLWQAEETQHARVRAAVISAVAFMILPAALFFVPLPSSVIASAVLMAEHEAVAHARESGFVESINIETGADVAEGQVLVALNNDLRQEEIYSAQSKVDASVRLIDAYRIHNPAFVTQEQTKLTMHEHALNHSVARQEDLKVNSPMIGKVVDCLNEKDMGRFLSVGEPVATIISGKWQVRAILNEEQIASVNPEVGQQVVFKSASRAWRDVQGTIARISPAGSRSVELATLTHVAGGQIAVDPITGNAAEPYFEIVIDLPEKDVGGLRYGSTGAVQLAAVPKPIGVRLTHRVARFVNKLFRE